MAISARRRRSGMPASFAGADAMPAKAPTWMMRSSSSTGWDTVRSTESRDLFGAIQVAWCKSNGQSEFVAAQPGDDCLLAELAAKRSGDRLQQPFPGLVAVLVVDGFKAMDLEGDDDQVFGPGAGFGLKLGDAVGKALAVEKPGRESVVARSAARCSCSARTSASCCRSTYLRQPKRIKATFSVKAVLARRTSLANSRLRRGAAEEGAAVPDQQQDRDDEDGKHDRIAPRTGEARTFRLSPLPIIDRCLRSNA